MAEDFDNPQAEQEFIPPTPDIIDFGTIQSESLEIFGPAMAAAQLNFTDPPREKTAKITTRNGGSFSYKYASMQGCYSCTRKHLNKEGIFVAVYKSMDHALGLARVTVKLQKGNEYIGSSASTPIKNTDQSYTWAQASAWTYMERYLYSGLTGIAPDDDDDGAIASDSAPTKDQQQAKSQGKDAPPPQQAAKQPAKQAAPPAQQATPPPANFFKTAEGYKWQMIDVREYMKAKYPDIKSPSALTPIQSESILTFMSKVTPDKWRERNNSNAALLDDAVTTESPAQQATLEDPSFEELPNGYQE